MREVVTQTAEPASTREATERIVNILYDTYVKAYLKQVADNANQLNAEERTMLLRILKDFGDLFDGTLGNCNIGPINLELK